MIRKNPLIWVQLCVHDSRCRYYHVNVDICRVKQLDIDFPLMEMDDDKIDIAGYPGKALINDLGGIRGIDCIRLQTYLVAVVKAQAFMWGEIEPAVLDALRCCFSTHRSDHDKIHVVCSTCADDEGEEHQRNYEAEDDNDDESGIPAIGE